MLRYIAALYLVSACSVFTTTPDTPSFETRPTGTYRYISEDEPESTAWVLRKSGSAVIGAKLVNRREQVVVQHCFRGEAEGDRITHITQVAPPFNPASTWESGKVIDLTASYLSLSDPTEISTAEQTALETCISLFWR